MTRPAPQRLSAFTEQEITKAITDTVGTRPAYTPSLRVLRVVAVDIARKFSPRLPVNSLVRDLVQEATRAKPVTPEIARIYENISLRLLANRQRSPTRSSPGRGRAAIRPQVIAQPSTLG